MKLHVCSSGAGPDLALIHGWGFSAEVWDGVAEPLSQHFRVHRVDLPGYGGSRHLQPESIQAVADRVMAALPERVTLCGWSLGGHVALAALARHAKRVRELVLVAATPCFVRKPDWQDGIEPLMLEMFSKGLQKNPASLIGRFATLINQGDVAARELTRRFTALAATLPEAAALDSGLALLRELDLRPLLPRVPQPVLLVHGARDPLMPLAAARWAAATLPAARLEVFEDSAHAPFLSQPERFVSSLARFVATTETVASC